MNVMNVFTIKWMTMASWWKADFKLIRIINTNKGQTTIEYLLLLLVAVALIGHFAPIIQDFILGDCNAGSSAVMCQFERIWTSQGQYRSYPLF